MRDMIEKGYVYVATPPFYLIKKGSKFRYAWTEEERKEYIKELAGESGKGVSVQRYKGLGEMNAEQLWETTMNPQFRKLRRVQINNEASADKTFSMLMGDDVPPRRDFIEKNARYANIDA
jgi:DNA gyrase subunit B